MATTLNKVNSVQAQSDQVAFLGTEESNTPSVAREMKF